MMHSLDRRALLAGALAAPLMPSTRLFAAPATDARLLVVFLRGAYDSASALVPIASPFYAEARPTLAIPARGPGAATALDGDWGMAPVLTRALLPYWQRKQLAFVPFAGTTDLSRSHFHTQDTLETGLATGARGAPTGFLNRLATELGGAKPVAFTSQLPLIFRGPRPVPNMVIRGGGGGDRDPRRTSQLSRMYAGDRALGGAVAEDIAIRKEVSRALATEMLTSGKQAADASDFGRIAQRIGQVMRGQTNLGFVDIGGWDTHVGQAGALGFRLGVLADGLAGFASAIGPAAWPKTTVVVMSEFGRTIRENGARGTDHGRGTVFWVMGGGVRGGRIAGRQVKLVRANLNEDRDLPVLNEARAVFAGLFQRIYGLDAAALGRVFPGVRPLDAGLI